MLRKLYKVTSSVKKIKIPLLYKRIYKHYKIRKIRRKISKRIAYYKVEALRLVSLNIVGPFV
jgi:hypothetical protein